MIQDEDAPDLDEMETTTQRNRGKMRNAPPGPVAPMPKRARGSQKFPMNKKQPDEGDNPFKGTAPNKGGGGPAPAKGGGHGSIAIIISPMSNPVDEHRQSIRNDINKAIKTEKRRGPR